MRKGYPVWIRESGISDVWKTAPVAWESCWDMRRWVEEKWSPICDFQLSIVNWQSSIPCYALALHGSYLNNKSAPLPSDENVRQEIERFVRRLGYRLVLKELKHPARARPGEPVVLTTKWQNVGSAILAYVLGHAIGNCRLSFDNFQSKIENRKSAGTITVEKWMPGSVEMFTEEFFKELPDLPPGEVVEAVDRVVLPNDVPAGSLRLAIGVVGEETLEPVLRLGIKGRTDEGWYPLSELKVLE